MTEKRFTAFTDFLGGTQTILDNGERKTLQQLLDTMNELAEENEQLKKQLQNTSDQRDEFFRGARENANRVGKLKKENEQLKQKLQQCRKFLNDDLDIALGFISHKGYSLKDLKEYEKKLKGDVE